MERIVAKNCSLLLRMHGLVAEGQHGFCQGRSCILPNWLPFIMTDLLFLISNLHSELILFFSTGQKRLTKLITACYCPNFTGIAYGMRSNA